MRERYLTTDETERLLAALEPFSTTPLRWRFAQMIRLLMLTGCRVGEIVRGRWEWVNDDAAVMLIPAANHKTGSDGKKRKVHLAPATLLILQQLRERSNSEWIIAGNGENHLIGYQKLWDELLATAKITNLRIHDLRHNFASVGISQAGLTLPEIGGLLGHASPVTTQRYAHLVDQAAAAAAAKVAGFINP
jgi:integrase